MDTMRLVLSTMLLGLIIGGISPVEAQEKTSESATLAEELQEHDEFSTLLSVAKKTGMKSALSEGDYTILAPTDTALSDTDVQSMSQKKKKELLRNHLLDGTYPSGQIAKMDTVQTLEGETVPVKKKESGVEIGDGMVVEDDVEASNGVIHVVDDVVVSPDDAKKTSEGESKEKKSSS